MPNKTTTQFSTRKRLIVAAISACFASAPVWGNPTAPQVVNGSASFSQAGKLLTVTNSNGTIINWNTFSIGANETTRFNQASASSSVLNRVLANDPSVLLGTLSSNGRVWLVNPAGIMVGQGARIDVGAFVASTLKVRNEDFLANRLNFQATPNAGKIENHGQITTPSGGSVYLIAPAVENHGIINAPNGEVILAAGQTAQLIDTGTPGVKVDITGAEGNVTNLGQIVAEAGRIGMAGVLVKNSGTLNASSLVKEGGRIFLRASKDANIDGAGRVVTTGAKGGSVDIAVDRSGDPSAPGVLVLTGAIDAQGTNGAGGTVRIKADSILSSSAINADGTAAGGLIDVQAAKRALSTSSAQYTTNSTHGMGGEILVSASVSNYTSGSYSATGAVGGKLTLSGDEIKLAGAQLSASGNHGGGSIHIGGLIHGAAGFSAEGSALTNATNVLANRSTRFSADALQTGNGGEVVLWSDQAMRFSGNISARGGALSGNGGNAEVSGLASLSYNGLTNLSAANGLSGTLLLDPRNITIAAGSGALAGAGAGAGGPYHEILDPTPGAGEGFGGLQNLVLNSGNIMVSSPLDSAFALNSGAVYLYSPAGSLVSALVGSTAGDKVGAVTSIGHVGPFDLGGLTTLTNGNVVVASNNWNGTLGAVTWMNGTTGALSNGNIGGAIAASNSLLGGTAGDKVGFGISELANGNLLVLTPTWNSGGVAANAMGAVTWMNGASGKLSDATNGGNVSVANSLVGNAAGDQVGLGGITPLTDHSTYWNYALLSPQWGSGGVAANALGAVTWLDGANGKLSTTATGGVLSAGNSLVGSTAGDKVGTMSLTYYLGFGTPNTSDFNGITVGASGNAVVTSNNWNSGGVAAGAGAVTWMNGATGALSDATLSGVVSSANSLVGSAAGDKAGTFAIREYYGPRDANGIVWLNNGNFLVRNGQWGSGGVANAGKGAVTWGSGTAGISGVVSSFNSIVGSVSGDLVGAGWQEFFTADPGDPGLVRLPNSNYVVVSSRWGGGKGAVTWGNGASGTSGVVSGVATTGNALSLVGAVAGNFVGAQGIAVQSGGSNYVVKSPWFDFNTLTDNGAITWMNGSTGALSNGAFGGVVDGTNSLMGGFAFDNVGAVTPLNNGNFLAATPVWSGGSPATGLGAVTWMSGATGKLADLANGGVISAANSLVGSTAGDNVGSGRVGSVSGPTDGITEITDGATFWNYVVNSPKWNNGGTAANAGAVTWGNGATGVTGVVSSANSLVGSTANDFVGNGGITRLFNGNYLVASSNWANGAAANAGAVTWASGTTGVSGAVSSANSLVGSTLDDLVGNGGIIALANGNYVVRSSYNWNNGVATDAGAVTWGSGTTGVSGAVSAANSLVGSASNDNVGGNGITVLANGNYLVSSYYWDNGAVPNAGAVTWGSGTTGISGAISSSNSLVGSAAFDIVGIGGITELSNGNYLVSSSSWANGAAANAGAVTWGSGTAGVTGVVSAANSLVGSTANDWVGIGGVTELSNGNYVVRSPDWTNGGTAAGAGAVTLGNGATGTVGIVSSSNSLVGSAAGDRVGSGGITPVSNYSTFWNYAVSSPDWGGAGAIQAGKGAVTWVNGQTGLLTTGTLGGVVGAANSLVGSNLGDRVGEANGGSGVRVLSNGNTLVRSTYWGGQFSALTWMDGATGALAGGATGGAVSATNSLLGSAVFDDLGNGHMGVTELHANGNWVITSPAWGNQSLGNGKGAVTWMNGVTGRLADGTFGGVVSAANSLVGGGVGDIVGGDYFCDCTKPTGGITALSDGNYVVNSPDWGARGSPANILATGAVTWGNGATGLVGLVTLSNSVSGVVSNITELASQPGKVLIGSGAANGGAGGVYLVGGGASAATGPLFANSPGADATVGAGWIAGTLDVGTNVVLQANNDLTQQVGAGIATTTGLGNLTLQAGRSVVLNDVIHIGGALDITANDAGAIPAYRAPGTAVLDNRLAALTAGAINLSNSGGDILAGAMTATTGAIGFGATGDVNIVNSVVATAGAINVTGANLNVVSTGAPAALQGASMTATIGGNINVTGSASGAAQIASAAGPQTISAVGNISLTGGGGGTNNSAAIRGNGDQSVSANGINLTGGAGGGGLNTGNHASIRSLGNQQISVGAGGLVLQGGGGSGNFAEVNQVGTVATQTITVNSAGTVAIAGGVGADGDNYARITNSGTAQSLAFTSGGTLTLAGGSVSSNAATTINNRAVLVGNTGSQTISGAPHIAIAGGNSGSNNYAGIFDNSNQNVSAASIVLSGGEGTNNFANVGQGGATGTQTVTVSGQIIGAAGGNTSNGTGNNTYISQTGSGLQRVTASAILLIGGGGVTGASNTAAIDTATGSTASQQVDIGAGGLTIQGGTGSGGGNHAGIWVLADNAVSSNTNATQVVNVAGGGGISVTGGSNSINSPSSLSNDAGIFQSATGSTAAQMVNAAGSGGILLTGGASGNLNSGYITSRAPSQAVVAGAGGIHLHGDGGATGAGDKGIIVQNHASGSQSITVNAGGSISELGGSGDGGSNAGQIYSVGTGPQTLTFTAPGSSIGMAGGSGGIISTASSGNFASIETTLGTQTIAGNITANNPAITLTGGASGGAANVGAAILGNSAVIRADAGVQSIAAGAIVLNAGIGGIDSSTTIQAPQQLIAASTVTINGGNDSGNFAGARIGGIGGTTPGPTSLTLTTTGNVALNGGAASGVSIGANALGGVATDITINSGGSVLQTSGTGGGARIGSPGTAIAGGNIAVTAAGDIILSGNASKLAPIQTTGNIALNAANVQVLQNSQVNAGGNATIVAAGKLTLNGTVSATGAGNSIILASGGDFVNNAGGAALVPGAGRWLIYSANPAGIVKGGLASIFRHYGSTIASYAPGSVAETGNGFVYASAPGNLTVTTSVTGTASNTYGVAPTASFGYTLSGFADTEDNATNVGLSGIFAYTPMPAIKTNAGSYSVAYAGGLASSVGYGFAAGPGVAYTVNPASLTLSPVSDTKAYNGNTSSTLAPTATGLVSGDTVTTLTQSFGSSHALGTGASTLVVNGGYVVNDTNGGANYIVATQTASGTITPAPLTPSLTNTGVTKIYDGKTSAPAGFSPAYNVSGLVAGDSVTINNSGSAYDSAHVASASSLSLNGLSLGSVAGSNASLASDYGLTNPIASVAATITPAALTVSANGQNKVYDATPNASITLSDNRVGSDVLTLAYGSAAFNDKNVGTAKPVSVSGITLGGADAGNYSVNTTTTTTSADISARALNVAATGVNKVYDGLTNASVTYADNRVAGDVLVASGSASFLDKNVGNAKSVNVSGISLTGTDAGNYTYNTAAATSADISARSLNVTTVGVNKVYDGLTSASVTYADNRVTGDVLVPGGSASYIDKQVGIAKTVNVNGITLTGTDAGNYSFNTTASTSADIGARALNVTAAGVNKVYDGLTSATVTYADNRVAGDVLTAGGSASYLNKNVGLAKRVDVSGIILTGTDAGNYTLSGTTATTSADITARALNVTATGVNKVYDGLTSASVTYADNRVAGDVLSVAGNASYLDKNVGIAKSVAVSGIALSGTDSGNYALAGVPTGLSASITQKPLAKWVGSTSGLWSNPANWDGNAIPDGANVLDVSIPTGGNYQVTYDASAGSTSLQNLNSAQVLAVSGGNLTISGKLDTAGYVQSGGVLGGSGNLSVNNSFSQSGGSIALTGAASAAITQATGDLIVRNLAAATVSLTAQGGSVSQTGPVVASSLVTKSVTGTDLRDIGNKLSSFTATNSGSGNVSLTNSGALSIGSISNTNGNISVDNAGALTTVGAINAPAGTVSIVAHSPLTIGAGGVSAGGNITLSAGETPASTDHLTLDGAIQSTGSASSISLLVGDNLAQNANVTTNGGAVNASSQLGSISMALGAKTFTGGGSIDYAASSGNVVLSSLDAGSGAIDLSAGASIKPVAGFSGANLIGSKAVIVAGGNANLSTEVKQLDVKVAGTYSISDLLTGSVMSNVVSSVTAADQVLDQTLSTVTAVTQQQPMSTTNQTAPPPAAPPASTPGGSPALLLSNTTLTIGGAEGTFGGVAGAATGSATGSATDTPVAPRAGEEKLVGAKKDDVKTDDKKDDDKKKKEEQAGPKKQTDKPAAKKLATCS